MEAADSAQARRPDDGTGVLSQQLHALDGESAGDSTNVIRGKGFMELVRPIGGNSWCNIPISLVDPDRPILNE